MNSVYIKTENYCNIIHVLTVTFDQFNVPFLIKNILSTTKNLNISA